MKSFKRSESLDAFTPDSVFTSGATACLASASLIANAPAASISPAINPV